MKIKKFSKICCRFTCIWRGYEVFTQSRDEDLSKHALRSSGLFLNVTEMIKCPDCVQLQFKFHKTSTSKNKRKLKKYMCFTLMSLWIIFYKKKKKICELVKIMISFIVIGRTKYISVFYFSPEVMLSSCDTVYSSTI